MTNGPLPTAPGFQFRSGVQISPQDAKRIVEERETDDSKIYLGGIHPDFASDTVQGPASIVELARALQNNAQLIYQFVHDNIEWEPGWGVQKGGLGCLMDGMGNAFDQSLLLAQTFRQAGYTANIVLGTIQISQAAASAWFNTEDTDIWGSVNYCANMNIPANDYWDGTQYWLQMSHVWVQCVISGTTYTFDPSYKTYNRTTGVSSLATVLGYTASTFMSDAESGATIDGSGNFVQNMNRTNIRNDLATFAGNLQTWITSNNPTATVDNILGGQTIVPATIPLLQTSLPYEMPGDTPTIWTGDVPTTYKTTLQVQFPDNSGGWCINQTFTSDQLAGGRLTVFFNSSLEPVLYLNGTAVQTGIAQGTGTWNSIQLTVTHNAYSVTWYNQQWWQSYIWAGQYYLIANAWGNLGRGQADFHQKQLSANMAAGGSATSEPVLGETLSTIWFNWAAQNSKVCDLTNRIMVCHTMYNHQVGMVYHNDGPGTDLGGVSGSSTNLNNDTTKTPINDTILAMHGVALEAAVLQQVPGLAHGVSATKVIDAANRSAWVTIGGTKTAGDVLTISVHDTALTGGTKSDSHTVLAGDTLTSIATAIASAINGDTSLAAIGVTATSSGAAITVTSNSGNMTTYTSSTSVGATETITIAFQKIYKGTSANWNTGIDVATILTGNGYNATDMANIYTWYISGGDSVVIADNPSNTISAWTGWGYFAYPAAGAYGIVNGVLKGAVPGGPQAPGTTNGGTLINQPDPVGIIPGIIFSSEPIDMFCGAYTYQREDFSVGSGDYPYKLSFSRVYDSRNQNTLGPLGLGWTHNFATAALTSSDGFLGMASQCALAGAASIAEIFVCTDLVSDTTRPVAKLVTMSLADEWWIEQITGNSAIISMPNGKVVFTKQTDGTYAPPPNNASTLTSTGSAYTVADPQGNKSTFNTNGTIASTIYANGVTVAYTYSSGLLQSVTNGIGRTLTFGYTGGLLTSVTDGTRTINYGYDANNDLTSFTDATLEETTYSYTMPGQMTSFYKPANPTTAVVTNTYDSLGRMKTQANARGQTWSYYFSGSYSQETDPLGHTHTLYFNSLGSPTRDIDALGNETDYAYDGLNRMTQKTLPLGNYAQYVYDSNNNVLTRTDVAKSGSGLSNIVQNFTYDPTWAKLKTAEDGNGNTTTYGYDPTYGNLLTIQKPMVGGSTPEITYTYNGRGQVLTKTDETGIVTKYTYDATTEKMLTKVVDYAASGHLNLTTSYGYDSAGNVNSLTDPNTNVTTFVFNNERRLTQKTDPTPFSYVTNLAYDANGNQNSVERQSGGTPAWQTYTTTYTVTDKKYQLTDPAGKMATFAYDGKDRPYTITDAAARVWTFAYDADDRIYTITDPTSTIADTRTYTNNGLLYQRSDARSETTTYSYDGFDRLNETLYQDTSYEQNSSYDANGNVLTQVTRSANTITNTYDVLNRLSTKTPTGEATTTYVYDLAGRGLTVSTPVVAGNPATGTYTLSYDTAGRFNEESTPDSKNITYGLDSNGNVTQVTYPDGYYVTRVYDQLNRLTNLKLNGSLSDAAQFTYNQLSQRTGITYGNGVVTSFAPQLSEDVTALSHIFSGSMVSFNYGFNSVHQETSRGTTNLAYIWHPAATSTTSYGTANNVNEYPTVGGTSYSYDGNANLAGDGTWTYGYDTENQLITASKTGTSLSFVYDPMSRQVQKTNGTTLTRYIYGGGNMPCHCSCECGTDDRPELLYATYDGTLGTLQNRYVYSDDTDEPLITVSGAGTITYMHPDRLGSIIALSGSAGTVSNSFTYGPFGESTAGSVTIFGFTGQRFDSETGLYYYKARYYSTTIGRFLQPDPIGYKHDLNLYVYADNDPLNVKDPTGMYSTPILGEAPTGGGSGGGKEGGTGGGGAGGGGGGGLSWEPSRPDPIIIGIVGRNPISPNECRKWCLAICGGEIWPCFPDCLKRCLPSPQVPAPPVIGLL